MKIEKICEYLNEIGILEYENINIFLEIYSKLNNGNYSTEIDKLRDTLIIYLNNNFIKNNKLRILCQSIISSFNNYQIILKYRTLNNMKDILLNKIKNKYINFFFNISLFILKKSLSKRNASNKSLRKILPKKSNKNINHKSNEEINQNNSELISSDDERECTFTPHINKDFKGYKKTAGNAESHIYYSPAFNISSKYPFTSYQNNVSSNMNNNNIQRNILNNNISHEQSYYSNFSNSNNYNNLNISNDSRSNRSYKIYENNFQNQNIDYNIDYIPIGIKNEFLNNNYYQDINNNYNNYRILNDNYKNQIHMNYNNPNLNNRYLYNLNKSNYSENNNKNEDFFNKEMIHIQKVKDKIQNMKIEK